MNRGDVESFFKTLLLGDFEENQNTAAQLVGGLISLIPVLDQVLDVRDVSGSLFQICRRGGFQQADSTQLVNLGFAAFGAVPEVGSAFKTVFKPVWKERRAAKGAVHGGLESVEALLGLGKGGAIRWVRQELLGKWASRTQQVIMTVEGALASCIALTEFIATASGWKDWLIPDSIQALAKNMLPGLRKLQNQISAPLRRASEEIRLFLEDLLGEQAAAIAMGLGQRAVMASAVAGTRTKNGHNAADKHPTGQAPKHEKVKHVATDARTDAKKSAGPVHSATQSRRSRFTDLANKYVGVQGEHMSDYYCQNTKGWGHKAIHDQEQVNTAKLNDSGKLVALWPVKARGRGIDGVWKSNGPKPYAIIEAKYSLDPTKSLPALLGEAWDKSEKDGGTQKSYKKGGRFGTKGGASEEGTIRQTNGKVTQMSKSWVERRLARAVRGEPLADLILLKGYSRHVQFFSVPQTVAHAEALLKHLAQQPVSAGMHAAHEITCEWGDHDIEKVTDNRAGLKKTGRDKRTR